jgi:lysozyme
VARALGIDVSHHCRVTDFPSVLDDGITLFGMKATEGQTFIDPTLAFHRAGARMQPFTLVVYYHYGRPGDPAREAGRFMDTVGPLRDNERLVLDLEGETVADLPAAPEAMIPWLDGFYTELMRGACTDRRPILYSSKRVWNMFGNPAWDLAGEMDLWVPRYGAAEPELPAPWNAWTFWQWTDSRITPGVSKACDSSYFNGDEAALRSYARSTAQVA